jgi:hypothetical protein
MDLFIAARRADGTKFKAWATNVDSVEQARQMVMGEQGVKTVLIGLPGALSVDSSPIPDDEIEDQIEVKNAG